MAKLFDALYRSEPGHTIDDAYLNVRWFSFDARLHPLEEALVSWQEETRIVQEKVLDHSETVIANLRDRLIEITELEWLVASSTTPRTLVEGETATFTIVLADRPLFTPGPWSIVSRIATPDDYALVRSLGFNRETGQWDADVVSVTGNPGPHNDWTIASTAGSTLAQMEMLAQGIAARDLAVSSATGAAANAATVAADKATVAEDKAIVAGHKTTATTAAQTATTQAGIATTKAAEAATSAASIAGGPVVSVAGHTDVVTVEELKTSLAYAVADIQGLADALAAKATPADITSAINALKGGVSAAYDTFVELQAMMEADDTAATALAALVATRHEQVAVYGFSR